jgi:hypothetical protein
MEAEIDKNEDESRKDLPKGRRASTRAGPGSNLLPLISAAHSIGWFVPPPLRAALMLACVYGSYVSLVG